jgi:hypothetical protein
LKTLSAGNLKKLNGPIEEEKEIGKGMKEMGGGSGFQSGFETQSFLRMVLTEVVSPVKKKDFV